LKDDPMEIYIPLNELVYCLRPETRDVTRSLYWTAWLLKYSSQFKKQNKTELVCNIRSNPYVDDKFAHHIVWLLWDTVMDASKNSPQAGPLEPYIEALFKLHCLRWNPANLKSRICFLINAIVYICESTTMDIHYKVPQDIIAIKQLTSNIPQWIQAILQTQKTFS